LHGLTQLFARPADDHASALPHADVILKVGIDVLQRSSSESHSD